MENRPSWNNYFMELAKTASTRSSCLSRKVGAVLVKDYRVISMGYNGPVSGLPHCDECYRKSGQNLYLCKATHAEENAIIQCALYGPSTINSTLYCTLQPCFHCAKLIVQSKIKQVIFLETYPESEGLSLLSEANISALKYLEASNGNYSE